MFRVLTAVVLLVIAVVCANGDPAHDALVNLTKKLHSGHGLTYDVNSWGQSKYIDFRTGEFLLTAYLAKSNGNVVNCYDQAGALYIMSRMMGINSEFVFMGNRTVRNPRTGAVLYTNGKPPFGFVNPVDLVGEELCNNPFYPNTTSGKITSDSDETDPAVRTMFVNHAFVRHAGLIYDACALYLGTGNLQQYATATIDISSVPERQSSPDGATWGGNEDGVFSQAEVDNALDLSQQPIKGFK